MGVSVGVSVGVGVTVTEAINEGVNEAETAGVHGKRGVDTVHGGTVGRGVVTAIA